MNTFTVKLVHFMFPGYVREWEAYADDIEKYVRQLETENIELRYGKIKTKRINDDLAIGMLPGFTKGAKDLVPVMDSEGNIDLVSQGLANGHTPIDIEIVPDNSIREIAYDVMGSVLGKTKHVNSPKGENSKAKSNGNKSKDNGSFVSGKIDWIQVRNVMSDSDKLNRMLNDEECKWLESTVAKWNSKGHPFDNMVDWTVKHFTSNGKK